MSTPWPKPWSGANPMSAWINRMLQRCKEEVLLESKDFRRVQTPNGYFLESKIQGGKGGTAAPSTDIQLFAITTLNGNDWFNANKVVNMHYDGSLQLTIGQLQGAFKIAKATNIRRSVVKETIDGIPITYRSIPPGSPLNGVNDNNRVANDGTSDELQCVYPRFMTVTDPGGSGIGQIGLVSTNAQCLVFAVSMPGGTGVFDLTDPAHPAAITWLEISPSRVWAKRYRPL